MCRKAPNLWFTCSWFQIFWNFSFKSCIFRLLIDLRTFVVAIYTLFFRRFFGNFLAFRMYAHIVSHILCLFGFFCLLAYQFFVHLDVFMLYEPVPSWKTICEISIFSTSTSSLIISQNLWGKNPQNYQPEPDLWKIFSSSYPQSHFVWLMPPLLLAY